LTLSDIAIRVENIAKKYQIAKSQERYQTFRDVLTTTVTAPFRRIGSVLRGEAATINQEEFWALRDISFKVHQGETIGIIGHNGAGKSTLLKVLSRITEPTSGFAEIHGRVGALLEVGTGFHLELTGRENIYMNGAILGMSRADMNRKFDDIVAFAGVEQFVETAVKHYSSGMSLRLGFAVAAYLEPDILIVDEVLAVGDMEFQRRCLGKLSEVSSSGRTVIFVSHNMTAISSLTERVLVLKQGKVVMSAPTKDAISEYLKSSSSNSGKIIWEAGERPGDEDIEIVACILNNGMPTDIESHNPLTISIHYIVKQPVRGLRIGFEITTNDGVLLFRAYADDNEREILPVAPGEYVSTCVVPPNLLNEGLHFISLRANIHAVKHIVVLNNLLSFQIVNTEGVNASYGRVRPGVISPQLNWETQPLALMAPH